MKKILFFAAAAVAMLASCSQNDDLTAPKVAQQDQQQEAIQFGTYIGRQAQTRAGYEGAITTTELQDAKDGTKTKGFGVFAHYASDGTAYNSLTSRTPNFMYNEQIYYNSGWKYDNIKYWPNGTNRTTSAADDENATSTTANKVSFFAYAPYVSEGSGDYGITDLSGNSAADNPKVTYTLDNAHFVDLLWGTAGTNGVDVAGNAQNGTVISTTANGSATSPDANYANIAVNADMTKQKVDGVVQFAFKHALSQVAGYSTTAYGGLSVIADIDDGVNETTPTIGASSAETGGTLDPSKTKVTITSITITPDRTDTNGDGLYDNAMPTIGVLDLATGSWTNTAATAATQLNFTHVINNNPSEGQYTLNTAIKTPTTLTEWDNIKDVTGVLSTAPTNVYASAAATPLIFLPGTTPKLTFTIQYEVCTKDTKLAAGCSIVTQTITKTISFGTPVQLNKRYNILIHLGLTGIKFDATVSDWVEDIDNDNDVDASDTQAVNLPINVI